MTRTIDRADSSEASASGGLIARVRRRIGRRGILVAAALAAFAIAAAFNWSWLVAVGIAPLVLALAACAAMCALILCKGGGKSGSTDGATGSQAG